MKLWIFVLVVVGLSLLWVVSEFAVQPLLDMMDRKHTDAVVQPTANHVERQPGTVLAEPAPIQESINVTLTDLDGRDLVCRIVAASETEVEVLRAADQQKFTIGLARLNASSREMVQAWRSSSKLSAESDFERYQKAKESVRVTVVVSENTPDTAELKRFLNSQDFNYIVYDAIKSSRGRELMEEHGLSRGPAFIIGDQVLVGANGQLIREAIVQEYEQRHTSP